MMKTNTEHSALIVHWLEEHKGLITKVVRLYTYTREDGQDLYQEIAVQLWGSIDSFQGKSKVSTWIYQVSLNTAMAWSRKSNKHSQDTKDIPSLAPKTPTQIAESDEKLDWLYEEIRKLPELKRSLVLLYLDGLSYKEISSILGIPESNVGVKLKRTKDYLTKLVEGESHES